MAVLYAKIDNHYSKLSSGRFDSFLTKPQWPSIHNIKDSCRKLSQFIDDKAAIGTDCTAISFNLIKNSKALFKIAKI